MISHNDLARALRNQHIHTSDKQVAEILPNPHCGFSFRDQLRRALRAEELGIQMLAFIQDVANSNPAGYSPAQPARQFLHDRHIEVVEGFFHTQDAAIADARTKFYKATRP